MQEHVTLFSDSKALWYSDASNGFLRVHICFVFLWLYFLGFTISIILLGLSSSYITDLSKKGDKVRSSLLALFGRRGTLNGYTFVLRVGRRVDLTRLTKCYITFFIYFYLYYFMTKLAVITWL